jgi:hypothetical protein
MNPTAALLAAVRTRLLVDAGVLAEFTGTPVVAVNPPDNAALPFITINTAGSTEWSTDTWYGRRTLIDVHAWTTLEAGGRAKALAILFAAEKALRAPLTLSGHACVLLRFEGHQDMLEGDRRTVHGVATFRALTQET